jgi:hypothetical protein
MSNNAEDKNSNKIFPRNLTAKAAYLVKGNPMNSRPEDSVENCYPGLEFDQRNIDKVFFPGLLFEFHREYAFDPLVKYGLDHIQPVLRGIKESTVLLPADIDYTGKPDDDKIFIWRIEAAEFGLNLDTSIFTNHDTDSGLSIWAYVREIPAGTCLKLLIAPATTQAAADIFKEALAAYNSAKTDMAQRDDSGKLLWAVLLGNRTMMIDDESGVINLETVEPGDLTRSLCNPWQYDFRDCKCYYWAANKPDIVSNAFGTEEFLDFLRKDRNHYPAVPASTEQAWLSQEITHVDMISNWQQLPVVLDDREVNYAIMDIIDSLRNLAPVEHALCVEYLHAYYSMDLDKVKPAADEVLRIAIDEMRHFRWVNEMLGLLYAAPVIDRAKDYGPAFNNRKFTLAEMTKDTLEWFLDVERPSQSINVPGQIDGMYVRLHELIIVNKHVLPQAEQLCEIIKLIIDEGDGHYHRYQFIEKSLDPFWNSGESFLYPSSQYPTPHDDIYAEISNKAYLLLLAGLQISFSLRESSSGKVIQFAIRSMHLMDKFNRLLAQNGRLPDFEMPPLAIFQSPNLIEIIDAVEVQIKALSEKLKQHSQQAFMMNLAVSEPNNLQVQMQSMAEDTISQQLDTIDSIRGELNKIKPIENKPGGTKPSPPVKDNKD